jgi:hypothetical protein
LFTWNPLDIAGMRSFFPVLSTRKQKKFEELGQNMGRERSNARAGSNGKVCVTCPFMSTVFR